MLALNLVPSPSIHLLDWNRPLLHGAVLHLAREWSGAGPLDLASQLIIVPTRRAGRRLREGLAAHAATRHQAVFPPRVVLPEHVLTETLAPGQTATNEAMLVAWIEVLRGLQIEDFDAVFPIAPPDSGFAWAARLARQFLHLQAELGENGLRIADVPDRAGPFPESRRWQQLAELERRFEARLASSGLQSVHAARIAVADMGRAPDGIDRITLVATPDPMPLVLRRLEALAGTVAVEVLVHGPDTADFDAWGRPVIDSWVHRPLDLADFEALVRPCLDPSAQADTIAAIATACGADADGLLGIAVADPEIRAPLHHRLRQAGLRSYDPEGTAHRQGELFRILELLLALVEEPACDTACALVRCPTVLAWLGGRAEDGFSTASLLEALDALRATHLPPTIADAIAHARGHRPRSGEVSWQPAADALESIQDLIARAARGFPEGVQEVLATVFGQRSYHIGQDEDLRAIAAAEAWAASAQATADAVGRIGRLGARDTWRLALQQFAQAPYFEEKPPGAVELQGWLELHWDDAPHLLVAGLNDGRVPAAIVGDAFLPEALRERLGLRTNATRLARDAYLLHALLASRSTAGRVDLLVGRTSAAGEPLRPSRLLLQCAAKDLPARVEYLFGELPAPAGASALAWRRAWQVTPPPPEPVEAVSVTAFHDHLACPFRFYLRHKLRMRAVDPLKEELDARDFGNLVHHALEGLFLEPAMRGCTDEARIKALLADRFDRRARALYGAHVPVPLLVQLESGRQRLAHAARVHAEDAVRGWVIHAVEQKFTCPIGPIAVTGRIDRIDRHVSTGSIRVLDYKTYDQPKTPQGTHTRRARAGMLPEPPAYALFTTPEGIELAWTDLQLPLYRRALAAEYGHAIQIGYFNLPKAATETVINLWDGFDDVWQAAADRCADGVAEAIAQGTFWPPAEELEYEDDFEPLFQQGTAASVAWLANPRIAAP